MQYARSPPLLLESGVASGGSGGDEMVSGRLDTIHRRLSYRTQLVEMTVFRRRKSSPFQICCPTYTSDTDVACPHRAVYASTRLPTSDVTRARRHVPSSLHEIIDRPNFNYACRTPQKQLSKAYTQIKSTHKAQNPPRPLHCAL